MRRRRLRHFNCVASASGLPAGALAHDVRRLPTVSPSFYPRFCSTTTPLDTVERQAVHRAATGAGLRLLFGGPPGGGKTQYALWLAKRLGRDVMLKRPSDLLSKYIGDSEKQIASAFRNAARAGSVLIIDEADALLYDRSIATHSWEHSQIAEFLQQIQEYNGILIACTNRVDAVDPALRRRFHRQVTGVSGISCAGHTTMKRCEYTPFSALKRRGSGSRSLPVPRIFLPTPISIHLSGCS